VDTPPRPLLLIRKSCDGDNSITLGWGTRVGWLSPTPVRDSNPTVTNGITMLGDRILVMESRLFGNRYDRR
jgi:hypothetical protein